MVRRPAGAPRGRSWFCRTLAGKHRIAILVALLTTFKAKGSLCVRRGMSWSSSGRRINSCETASELRGSIRWSFFSDAADLTSLRYWFNSNIWYKKKHSPSLGIQKQDQKISPQFLERKKVCACVLCNVNTTGIIFLWDLSQPSSTGAFCSLMGGWGNVSAMHSTLSPLSVGMKPIRSLQVESGVTRRPRPCTPHESVSERRLSSGQGGAYCSWVLLGSPTVTVCPVSASLCGGRASAPAPVSDPCTSWSCRSAAASELCRRSPVEAETGLVLGNTAYDSN